MTKLLKAALRYAEHGIRVLPCGGDDGKTPLVPHGKDDATTDPGPIRDWWTRWPDANIGGIPGPRYLVVDIDSLEAEEEAIRLGLRAEPAPYVRTGRGEHIWFRHPGGEVGNIRVGRLEVRADAGYVLLPPSVHRRTGRVYQWGDDMKLADAPTLPPQFLEALKAAAKAHQPAGRLLGILPEGSRNVALTSLAGSLRRRGASEEAILAALRVENATRCKPPLDDRELERIAASVAKYPPSEEGSATHALENWEEPVSLDCIAVPEFPVGALPRWLGDYVRAVAVAYQVPADLPGALSLAMLATAAGGRVEIEARPGWIEPVNLYVLGVAPPAERKSAVFRELTAPVLEFEAELCERLRPTIESARAHRRMKQERQRRLEREAVNSRNPAEAREAEAEALRLARELAVEREPALPRLVADDVTPEALTSLLAEQNGRIAVLSAESTLFDVVAGRYNDGTPNFDALLKAHAGDPIRVDRKGRPAEHIPRPALTLGICTQPEALRGLLRRRDFRGRGLLGRILYVLPQSLVGHREVAPPPVPEAVRRAYSEQLQALLEKFSSWGEDKPTCVVRLSPEANRRLMEFERWLEPQLAPGAELGAMADWAGKLAGAIVRIAGLLHLAESTEPEIGRETMERAVSLGEYFLAHARAAYGTMGADPAVEVARRIVEHIRTNKAPVVKARDLYRAVRTIVERPADLEPAFRLLEELGYLRPVIEPHQGPGRPSPKFAVNPAVWVDKMDKKLVQGNFVHSVHFVHRDEEPTEPPGDRSNPPSWLVQAVDLVPVDDFTEGPAEAGPGLERDVPPPVDDYEEVERRAIQEEGRLGRAGR
ncbi:MAG: hypothetical protein KatS3mg081_0599 [Gemmatimonadales bacterium]|nr:MAG: hypothetical protein KatS3mg081_0599 [Gemmatimonadales bacterium]